MSSIFTLSEAIASLSEQTGHQWTGPELLGLAVRFNVTLNAVVPPHVRSELVYFVNGGLLHLPKSDDLDFLLEPYYVPNPTRGLAALFPYQIQLLMLQGEATTETPADFADQRSDATVQKLSQKVRVTPDEIRVMPETLALILRRWQDDQTRRRESVASIAPSAPSGAPEQPIKKDEKDWREHALAIADELFDGDTQNNCRDSLDGYSRRVTDEMQKRNIRGPRGLIDNHKTVQRDALQGEKWWKHKKK